VIEGHHQRSQARPPWSSMLSSWISMAAN